MGWVEPVTTVKYLSTPGYSASPSNGNLPQRRHTKPSSVSMFVFLKRAVTLFVICNIPLLHWVLTLTLAALSNDAHLLFIYLFFLSNGRKRFCGTIHAPQPLHPCCSLTLVGNGLLFSEPAQHSLKIDSWQMHIFLVLKGSLVTTHHLEHAICFYPFPPQVKRGC